MIYYGKTLSSSGPKLTAVQQHLPLQYFKAKKGGDIFLII